MPRKKTGQVYVEPHDGPSGPHFDIRIDLPDGGRSKRACMPPGMTKLEARDEARRLKVLWWTAGAEKGRGEPAKPKGEGETLDRYTDRWIRSRRDQSDVGIHLRRHILPILGLDTVLANVTRADVERVVAHLDGQVKAGAMAWKTAHNIYSTLTKMLDDAVHAKDATLRGLAERPDPSDGVRGPDRGEDKQCAYLWPREAMTLLGCEAIPGPLRSLYAFALFTGLRSGEISVLRVEDVVLDGGYVSVHKARDHVAGGEKSTKGKRARRVPIEPALRPLLESIVADRARGDALFGIPDPKALAKGIREDLLRAGVDRAELHADTDHQRQFSFHDCRHTFATWLALRGESELTIQSRLGHASTKMTQRYIAEAEAVGHGDVGQPFGPLPPNLAGPVLKAARESRPSRPKPAKSDDDEGMTPPSHCLT